jgi:hypothetical protein
MCRLFETLAMHETPGRAAEQLRPSVGHCPSVRRGRPVLLGRQTGSTNAGGPETSEVDTTLTPPGTQYGAIQGKVGKRNRLIYAEFAILCKVVFLQNAEKLKAPNVRIRGNCTSRAAIRIFNALAER